MLRSAKPLALILAVLVLLPGTAALLDVDPTAHPGTPLARPETRGIWVEPALTDAFTADPTAPRIVLLGLQTTDDERTRRYLDGLALPYHLFEHIPVGAVVADADDLDALRNTPRLVSLAENERVEPLLLPEGRSSNLGGTGDGLVRADRARELGFDGSGIGIAIVDSGIDGNHPELTWRSAGGPLVQNMEFVIGKDGGLNTIDVGIPASVVLENRTDTDEVGGHGSHVAGTAAGTFSADGLFHGRAPGADLIGVAITPTIAMLWYLAGFDWIMENQDRYNIRIVSNSWGSEGPYSPYHPTNLATKAMDEAGLLVLFAAGNAGPDENSLYKYGQAPWVISVGSTHLDGAVSSFSSRGDAKRGTGPDVVAPGHNIVAPRNKPVNTVDQSLNTRYLDAGFIPFGSLERYRVLSGTSMATPQVAGVAALVLQAAPHLTPAEVRDVLYRTARPIYGHGYESAGHGMVDAEAAVLAAQGSPYVTDWVEPSEASWDGTERLYTYHGAFVGGVTSLRPFYQDMHVPVRLPAESLHIDVRWDAPIDRATASGLVLRIYDPEGGKVYEETLTQADEPGATTVVIDKATLEGAALEHSSAAYWRIELSLARGAVAFDVDARVRYATAELPLVETDDVTPPPPPPVERTPHGPIRIASDADFTAENGVVAGSGQETDPYIIEGWDIGGNSDHAMYIGGAAGTQAHLVVRDVRIHSSNGQCLVLENAHNIRFENVVVENCYWSVYIGGGTSDITFQDTTVQHGKYGFAIYGAHDLTFRNNTVWNHLQSGIVVSQGAAGGGSRYPASNALLFEDTLVRDAKIGLLTPGASDVTLRGTQMDNARVEFGTLTTGHTISDTRWLDGVTSYNYGILGTGTPRWPAATIIDAGSDRPFQPDGTVCFSGATISILAPRTLDEVSWTFGDGNGTYGEQYPCHVYADTSRVYEATVTVTTTTQTGEVEVFSDSVQIGRIGTG